MVWFQCDDCGENLKKPKLASHFNRCSASKLSCIDCGVVFDQHSVQAHTSCVSEVEKYGPKGVNKSANLFAAKPKIGKGQSGPEVDLSRGLSQRPPWSCSLCYVKATSREALELHAQGKKHRGKAKAAGAKESPPAGAKDAVLGTEEGNNNSLVDRMGSAETKSAVGVSSQPLEKKRKNEQVDGAEAEGDMKLSKKDKKAKKESPDSEVGDKGHEVAADSPCKKRKQVEQKQEQENVTGLESKGSGKKSKKRDKLSVPEENGHTSEKVSEVAEVAVIDQEEKKKDKKRKKGKKMKGAASNVNESNNVDENANQGSLLNGASSAYDTDTKGEHATPLVNGKKAKKGKASNVGEEPVTSEPLKTAQDEKSRTEKKKHKKSVSRFEPNEESVKKDKERETLVHEVSFCEWLPDDDVGGNGGTPTHPSVVEKSGEDTPTKLTDPDYEQVQSVSKVVKWKKIISEALGKSPDGMMKKKDLSKAVLSVALKVAEASSIQFDKVVLKEELMRQIKCNPKFVLDGKHVLLAPRAN